jgi:GntR family transcriptional regulator
MNLAELIGFEPSEGRGPLYRRLEERFRHAIESGALKPEQALPSERDLAEDFAVSRITIRKALDGLVASGLLNRRQGAGTFVAGRVEKSFSKLTSFSEDMAARGRSSRSEWINRSEGAVTPGRIADARPQPGHAGLPLSPHPLRRRVGNGARIFDHPGVRAAQCRNRPWFALRSAERDRQPAGASAAAAAGGPVRRPAGSPDRRRAGAPGLLIERRGFLEDGRAVEMTQSWYRGDAYDFVAELNDLG